MFSRPRLALSLLPSAIPWTSRTHSHTYILRHDEDLIFSNRVRYIYIYILYSPEQNTLRLSKKMNYFTVKTKWNAFHLRSSFWHARHGMSKRARLNKKPHIKLAHTRLSSLCGFGSESPPFKTFVVSSNNPLYSVPPYPGHRHIHSIYTLAMGFMHNGFAFAKTTKKWHNFDRL